MKKSVLKLCCALAAGIFFTTPNLKAQDITTVVGSGTMGYNGDGIPATTAEMFSPFGVAVDNSGNIYIADFDNQRVREVSASTGIITTIAGTGTNGYNGDGIAATAAELNGPAGVTLDDTGNIYIVEYTSSRIRKISAATGLISTMAGNGTAGYNGDGIAATAAEINNPFACAVDGAGNIYIGDCHNSRLRKVTAATGLISTIAGTGTSGYNGDGISATTAEVASPRGVTVDQSGNVYFADEPNHRIRKVDATTGLISTVAGTGTGGYNGDNIAATTAELDFPTGMKFDAAGDMYIADYDNHRVREVNAATGIITTIAGTGTAGYNGDNIAATAAELDHPNEISLDDTGNVYICDNSNNRIRKVAEQCSGVAAGMIGNSSGNSFCVSGSDTLTLTGASIGSSVTYQWKYSANGTNYTNVGTGNTTYATGTITATSYYKVIVTCTASGISDSTGVDTITVSPVLTPTVTITANPGTNITSGESVSFSATVTNGGNNPLYQWRKNSVNIGGATTNQYTTSALANNDTISCFVNDNTPCNDSAISNKLLIHVGSGVQQLASNTNIQLYPNPNNGTFSIEGIIENGKEAQIEIFNLVGQTIYKAAVSIQNNKISKQISLPGAATSGIYFLKIKTDDGASVIKFMVAD